MTYDLWTGTQSANAGSTTSALPGKNWVLPRNSISSTPFACPYASHDGRASTLQTTRRGENRFRCGCPPEFLFVRLLALGKSLGNQTASLTFLSQTPLASPWRGFFILWTCKKENPATGGISTYHRVQCPLSRVILIVYP